jgi:DNA invertase Pin-like site-specific DNA recombinase
MGIGQNGVGVSEKERTMIASRTRDALARAKARDVTLGGPKLTEARVAAQVVIKATADKTPRTSCPSCEKRNALALRRYGQ